MIVRHAEGRLLCLAQPDHAVLAGRLAGPGRPTACPVAAPGNV